MCPYDTASLSAEVVGEAHHSHRFVVGGHATEESPHYQGDEWDGATDDCLPDPPGNPPLLAFGPAPLEPVRRFVVERAGEALGAPELSDLLQAVTEAAANSLIHGGGSGTVRLWATAGGVVCEVVDGGWIRQPVVGRARPGLDNEGGRGLWMVNQLCELVQRRSSPAGTVVRMHMARRGSPVGRPG